jgi:hypothetical protein
LVSNSDTPDEALTESHVLRDARMRQKYFVFHRGAG